MLERQASVDAFINGGQLGFISGDVTTLLDDVQELKPTDMPMVPRLLNRFYNQVMNKEWLGRSANICTKPTN